VWACHEAHRVAGQEQINSQSAAAGQINRCHIGCSGVSEGTAVLLGQWLKLCAFCQNTGFQVLKSCWELSNKVGGMVQREFVRIGEEREKGV